MFRTTTIQVLNDTSLFDSMQLQTRAALALSMRCWAQWAFENLYSFPALVKAHRFGVVVVGSQIEYEQPFDFFSADKFEVTGHAELIQDQRLLLGHIQFMHQGERFLRVLIITRPVTMPAENSFAAFPTRLEGHLLEKFTAHEVNPRRLARTVPTLIDALAREPQLAEAKVERRIHRHDCEAADQWSYIEIGVQAATAREALVLGAEQATKARLQPGLATPVRFVDLEIKRPLFLFDRYQIITQAYLSEERLTFVHTFRSQMGGQHVHAIVVERF